MTLAFVLIPFISGFFIGWVLRDVWFRVMLRRIIKEEENATNKLS